MSLERFKELEKRYKLKEVVRDKCPRCSGEIIHYTGKNQEGKSVNVRFCHYCTELEEG